MQIKTSRFETVFAQWHEVDAAAYLKALSGGHNYTTREEKLTAQTVA